jgi:hypothetical protein
MRTVHGARSSHPDTREVEKFCCCWHAIHRSKEQPEGYISLVVAENRLSFDILRPKLQQILSRPLPAELGTYHKQNLLTW